MKNENTKYYLKLLIAAFFCFGFQFLPPPAPITELGMNIIGIFIGAIVLVATVHPMWPAFLIIGLYVATPLYTLNSAIQASFGNFLPSFLISIFILGYALTKSGIAKKFILWFMTRPFLQGKPWLFTSFFLFSIIIIGYLMDIFALIAFYLSCVEIISTELGYKKGDKYPMGLGFGIAFLIAIVGASTPFQTNVVMVLAQYEAFTGVPTQIFDYISWSIVPMLVFFAAFMLVFRFIINPDMSNFAKFDINSIAGDKEEITPQQKGILAVYGTVVLVWVLPGILQILNVAPELVSYISGLGVSFPPFIGVAVMCAIRVENKPLLDIKEAARNINWQVIILTACNMIMANALGKEEVGFTAWFQQTAEPIVAGVGPLMFVAFIVLVTLIMTNVGSNAVAGVIAFQMASILVPTSLNLAVITFIVAFCTRAAFCLPSSCAAMATLYGDEWTVRGKILPYGLLMCLITLIIMVIVGYPYATLILG